MYLSMYTNQAPRAKLRHLPCTSTYGMIQSAIPYLGSHPLLPNHMMCMKTNDPSTRTFTVIVPLFLFRTKSRIALGCRSRPHFRGGQVQSTEEYLYRVTQNGYDRCVQNDQKRNIQGIRWGLGGGGGGGWIRDVTRVRYSTWYLAVKQ